MAPQSSHPPPHSPEESKEESRSKEKRSSTEAPEESVMKAKRPRPERRSKKKHDSSEAKKMDPKKQFERCWSHEDEVVLLKALNKRYLKGNNAASLDSHFYTTVKESFGEDLKGKITRKSLCGKVSRLRKKFLNEEAKGKKFCSKDEHKMLLYNLSKALWGRRASKDQYLLMEAYFSKMLPSSIPAGMTHLLPESKAEELYGRWKEMVLKECQIQCEKASLVKDLLTALLEEQGKPNAASSPSSEASSS